MSTPSSLTKLRSTKHRRQGRSRQLQLEQLDARLLLSVSGLPSSVPEHFASTKAYLPGDANLDGSFDSGDLVQVMQGGKYATGEPASWEEGDWNSDRRFDSLDLIFAHQVGHYQIGDVTVEESTEQAAVAITAALNNTGRLPHDYRPIGVGDDIRNWTPTVDRVSGVLPDNLGQAENAAAEAAAEDISACIQDTKFWLSLDTVSGFYFFSEFHLLAEGDDAQIWVQDDPGWPDSDPRSMPVVTCDQAEYMLGEFENKILPVEADVFGSADAHDGSAAVLPSLVGLPSDYYEDPEGRQVVLVSNVRDDNYYDPDYPIYVAGFYSDALESYFDRNTMSIDAFEWENRTGPDAQVPFLYEGVFAHEYQHLLHSDYDGTEENWINEGLSDFAEFLVGYGHPESHVAATSSLPENSLVAWEDQGPLEILSDYGHAYFFMHELYQSYGAQAIKELFLNPADGISGVNAMLSDLGSADTFADVYHRYAPGLYTIGYFEQLPDFQVELGPPGNPNPEAYASEGAPPWGTDYIWLNGHERVKNLEFNGVQFNPVEWTSDGEVLFGGSGNLVDNSMIAEADLTGVADATLTFDTMYDIEEGWDFGFVQVSTDGGTTWTSLTNASTTSSHDPQAHPDIVAQLPGLTGASGGWVPMSFDLSAYDGMQILVAFRYKTDWAFNGAGWYVDNINIAGAFTSDGSSTDGFQSLNELLGISNEFTVQLIGERNRHGESEFKTITVLSGGFMEDWAPIAELFDNYRSVVMLVTYDAPEWVGSYAGYSYELISGGDHVFPST